MHDQQHGGVDVSEIYISTFVLPIYLNSIRLYCMYSS